MTSSPSSKPSSSLSASSGSLPVLLGETYTPVPVSTPSSERVVVAVGVERVGDVALRVPGDLVVVVRRGEHVHVAVAVHVRREDRARAVGGGRDRVLRSRCRRAGVPSFSYQAIVLSSCDAESTSVSPSPSTSAGEDRRRAVDRGRDRVLGPGAHRRRAVVLVPGDLARRWRRRGEHVRVAVAVHVRGERPTWRRRRSSRSHARSTRRPPACRRSRTRRSCRRSTTRRARPCRRRRRCPPRRPTARRSRRVEIVCSVQAPDGRRAVVLVPGDRVVEARRGEHVQCRRRRPGPPRTTERAPSAAVEIACSGHAPTRRRAVVLVPGDRVVAGRRGEHVHVAVAVHVRREDRLGAVGARSRSRARASGPTDGVPSFSYQAIVSSPDDAESASRSPSPSRSAAKTEIGAVGRRSRSRAARRSSPCRSPAPSSRPSSSLSVSVGFVPAAASAALPSPSASKSSCPSTRLLASSSASSGSKPFATSKPSGSPSSSLSASSGSATFCCSYQAILSSLTDAESTSVVAVAVEVRREDRDWRRRRWSQIACAGARCRRRRAVVLVPGDLVVEVRRGEHVDVAVAVDVRGEDATRAVRGARDRVLGPAPTAGVPSFSYQAIVVVVRRRGEHVGVAVAVHVRGADHRSAPIGAAVEIDAPAKRRPPASRRSRTRRSSSNRRTGESTSRSPSPSRSAAKTDAGADRGGRDRMRASRRRPRACRRSRTRRSSLSGRTPRRAGPCRRRCPGPRRRPPDVTVAPRSSHRARSTRPPPACRRSRTRTSTSVLRRGEHVHVAVAVDVRREDRGRASSATVEITCSVHAPDERRAVVLVPGDRVVVVRRGEHVDVAVAVEVRRDDHRRAGRPRSRSRAARRRLPCRSPAPSSRPSSSVSVSVGFVPTAASAALPSPSASKSSCPSMRLSLSWSASSGSKPCATSNASSRPSSSESRSGEHGCGCRLDGLPVQPPPRSVHAWIGVDRRRSAARSSFARASGRASQAAGSRRGPSGKRSIGAARSASRKAASRRHSGSPRTTTAGARLDLHPDEAAALRMGCRRGARRTRSRSCRETPGRDGDGRASRCELAREHRPARAIAVAVGTRRPRPRRARSRS